LKEIRTSPVLVVDFGAQYAQVIARRVREVHVYSEIVPHDISAEEVKAKNPAAIILSGGPKSVNEDGAPSLDERIYDLGVPILGICYGAQLLARDLGGEVVRNGVGEYGRTGIRRSLASTSTLFSSLPTEFSVWMSHFDAITQAPVGATPTSSTAVSKVASFEDAVKKIAGVQFHPEVTHSEFGKEV